MNEPRLVIPDELHLYIEKQLARIDRDRAETARQMQEFKLAPGLYRIEHWKAITAFMAAMAVLVGVLAGLAGYKLGSTPSAPQLPPIIIQVPK